MKILRLLLTAIFITVLALPATAHFAAQKSAKILTIETTDGEVSLNAKEITASAHTIPTGTCTLTSMTCANFVTSEFETIRFTGLMLPIETPSHTAQRMSSTLHKEIFHPPRT